MTRSEWSDWSDVQEHRASSLLEDHLFEEFDPHVNKDNVTIRTYAEVGSGPFSVHRCERRREVRVVRHRRG